MFLKLMGWACWSIFWQNKDISYVQRCTNIIYCFHWCHFFFFFAERFIKICYVLKFIFSPYLRASIIWNYFSYCLNRYFSSFLQKLLSEMNYHHNFNIFTVYKFEVILCFRNWRQIFSVLPPIQYNPLFFI